MELKRNGTSTTELTINGTSILFSYETPVAGYDNQGAFRTDQHYSSTTTKHINKYLGGKGVGRILEQSAINKLLEKG